MTPDEYLASITEPYNKTGEFERKVQPLLTELANLLGEMELPHLILIQTSHEHVNGSFKGDVATLSAGCPSRCLPAVCQSIAMVNPNVAEQMQSLQERCQLLGAKVGTREH